MSDYPQVSSEDLGEKNVIAVRRSKHLVHRFHLYDEELGPVSDYLESLKEETDD